MAVTALWAILWLPFLGQGEVFQVSEGREGVVVREILTSGELILPLRNGEIVPSKPILFHWLGAIVANLTGKYEEFELRLPSALAALVILLLPIFLLSPFIEPLILCLSSLLLVSMSGFYQLGIDGRVDMVFNAFVVSIVVLWLRGEMREKLQSSVVAEKRVAERRVAERLAERRTVEAILLGLLAGGAVLTKGPLGLVLPALVILSISVAEWRWHGIRRLFHHRALISLVVCIAIAAPWYYLATLRGSGGFVERQLVFENIARFFGGEGITRRPFWFYGPALIKETIPVGIFFLLFLGWCRIRSIRQSRGTSWHEWLRLHWETLSELERFAFRAGFTWFLTGVFFLSLSSGKRSAYLIPLLPGLCLGMAIWLKACWETEHDRLSRSAFANIPKLIAGLFVVYLGALAAFVPLLSFLQANLAIEPKTSVAFAAIRETIDEEYLLIWLYLGMCGAIGLWGVRFSNLRRLMASLFVVVVIPLVLFVNLGIIAKGKTHSYKDFARRLLQELPANEKINFIKTRRDESFDGLFFYYGKHVTMIDPILRPETPGLYVARRKWLELWQQSRNQLSLPIFHELFEGGRATDSAKERLVVFRLD